MLIKNAKIYGQEGKWDIYIKDGKFDKIANTLDIADLETIDAEGAIDQRSIRGFPCPFGLRGNLW